MDINQIVTTGTRAQELLYSVVQEHRDVAQKRIETASHFKCISDLLRHSNGAEGRWQAQMMGGQVSWAYDEQGISDIDVLYKDWQAARSKTVEMTQSAGDDFATKTIDIYMKAVNITVPMTWEQIVYNIIAHESYHRGQCSYLLQMFEVDPPNFDFPFMLSMV